MEGRYRILVVDDDRGMLMLLRQKLRKAGFEVVISHNSMDALRILSEEDNIDLIICDIMMPEMDGYEFRRRLLDNPHSRDIPFIFLTARADPADQVKGFRMRVDDYITKPFQPDVLLARARSVIERHEAYREMMITDSLTGLLNRKAIEERIGIELKRIQRYNEVCSIVFIDIDDFKHVNDTYGHEAGDGVLVELAGLLRRELRNTDYIGRYGGEEFLVCLVNTGKAVAVKVVERLLSVFREMAIGEDAIRCTFSAGIASAPEDGMEFDVLCRKADEAMYISKKEGKNRVTPWQEGGEGHL
jgi:diguanylate cyclase (GGDEF)-like protein